MSDVLIFPDTRGAILELIDGTEHVARVVQGEPVMVKVNAAYHVMADDYGAIDDEAQVVITSDPGTQGHIDRVDRISLDCYAPGEQAMNILNSILGLVVGAGIEIENGDYLDRVDVDQTPHEIPYPSDVMNQAMCKLLVTVRPV